VVKDIDPAVESAILRCLQKDPSKRPSSVRQVAAAFPGGDPLAAALAAGETPSPEMVAASGETEGLRPVVAWTLLAGVVVSVIAAILLSAQTKLYRRVPLEKPPDALAEHARDILQSVGYSEPPVDTAMGVYEGNEFLRYIEEHDRSKTRWDNLDTGAFVFWYRGSPRPLDSHSSSPDEPMVAGSVWTDDPPLDVSGMTLVRLNPRGHLTQFIAVPPQVETPAGAASSPDWAPLFSAAGLDPSKWPPTQPLWTPPVYSDARAAWIGSLAECPNIRNMAATKQPRIQSSPLNRN
jgi:serine/threonine-protein kinase